MIVMPLERQKSFNIYKLCRFLKETTCYLSVHLYRAVTLKNTINYRLLKTVNFHGISSADSECVIKGTKAIKRLEYFFYHLRIDNKVCLA